MPIQAIASNAIASKRYFSGILIELFRGFCSLMSELPNLSNHRSTFCWLVKDATQCRRILPKVSFGSY